MPSTLFLASVCVNIAHTNCSYWGSHNKSLAWSDRFGLQLILAMQHFTAASGDTSHPSMGCILRCVTKGDSIAGDTIVSSFVPPAVAIGWLNKTEKRWRVSCLFNQTITPQVIQNYVTSDAPEYGLRVDQ